MMDYNHRRAASDMAYTTNFKTANRRSGPIPRSAFAVNLEVPEQQFGRTANLNNIAAQKRSNVSKNVSNNTSSHYRSLSCEGTYTWESTTNSQTPASKSKASSGHRYSGLITPEDFPQPQLQNGLQAPCSGFRRGSESSTNSTTSTCTTVADGASAWSTWSAAATPETMSPTSPNSMILLQSPPERTSSKVGIVVTEASSMPTPTRPSRARAASHSAPKGFHNTPIESPVPEEAEVFLTLRSSRMQRSRPSQEANIAAQATVHTAEGIAISSLHQRRQQRQQKIAGKPQVKQPVRLRLTPLPTPSAGVQLGRTPSIRTPNSASPRTLKASRSMPQIRDHAGPPPAGPLPPIPAMPKVSPSMAASMHYSMPPTPLSSTFDAHPPHPSMPPPPPPHSPALSTTSSSRTLTASATHAQMPAQRQQTQAQADKSASWEEELLRHRKLLEQFPRPGEQMNDAPKLTRNHRSLGNLRARSRSLSRAAASSSGSSSREDSVVGESWVAQTFSLRGSKSQQRPSTSKSNKDFRMTDQPLPPLPIMPQEHKPSISVFEDDSEDEGHEGGDAVRKFVRNLFTRRTRSHVDMHAAKENRDPNGREGKSSVSSASPKESSMHGHNDRKKNHSASSNLSMATTVGANNCTSTTNTLTPTTPDVPAVQYCEPLEDHHNKDGFMTSPRSPTEIQVAPAPQKAPLAPLLTRMFVRRSN